MFAPRLQSKSYLFKLDLHKDGKRDEVQEGRLVRAVKILIAFATELFPDGLVWTMKSMVQCQGLEKTLVGYFNDRVQEQIAPVVSKTDKREFVTEFKVQPVAAVAERRRSGAMARRKSSR